MEQLRFIAERVVWQEVPGEVSLAFTIAGCPLRCPGCHSSDSWQPDQGTVLTSQYLARRLTTYRGLISCVAFMGGEWHPRALKSRLIQAKQAGLATCLYTGLEDEDVPDSLCQQLTYLKTGPWVAELGGLDDPRTNQTFVHIKSGRILNSLFQGAPNAATYNRTS